MEKQLDKDYKAETEKKKDEVFASLKTMGNSLLGHFGMSMDNFKTV